MDYRRDIEKWVNQALRQERVKRPELVQAALNDDRIKYFKVNLTVHIIKAIELVVNRRGNPPKLQTVKMLCQDMTRIFLKGLEGSVARRDESAIQKAERKKQEEDVKIMENTLAGNPEGEFEEMGLIIGETKEQSIGSV